MNATHDLLHAAKDFRDTSATKTRMTNSSMCNPRPSVEVEASHVPHH
jgi:hypothetical protein